MVVLCLYLPFAWLLVFADPGSDPWLLVRWYRLLPGVWPAALLVGGPTRWFMTVMGVITAAMIVVLTGLGMRSRWRLALSATIALAISIISSIVVYAMLAA